MTLHTEIKQFLAAVKDPASLTTTRVSLEQAVGLLERVAEPSIDEIFVQEAQLRNHMIDSGWTPPNQKPEDKL